MRVAAANAAYNAGHHYMMPPQAAYDPYSTSTSASIRLLFSTLNKHYRLIEDINNCLNIATYKITLIKAKLHFGVGKSTQQTAMGCPALYIILKRLDIP